MKKLMLKILIILSAVSCTNRNNNYYTDMNNQKKIVDAYFRYREDRNKIPSDLQEIVKNGYLPENGHFYSGYWDLSLFPDTISYKDSDYKIFNGFGGDKYQIIGLKCRENPKLWEFRSEITNYVRDKHKRTNPRANY